MFFAKVHKTAKPLQSYCKENCKASKPLKTNDLINFLFFVLQFCSDRDMYRKNGHLACKNRANGRSGSAGLVGGFCSGLKNCKKISQVLDFQGFAVLQWLCSGFAVLFNFTKNML
jgi:hypothetical protein